MNLADDRVVAQHHQVVDVHVGQGMEPFIQVFEQPGVHALFLGGGTRQLTHLGGKGAAQSQENQYGDKASAHFIVNGMVSDLELG